MKTVAVLFILCIAGIFAENQSDEFDEVLNFFTSCRKEYGFDDVKDLTSDQKICLFMSCSMKLGQILTSKGTLNLPYAIQHKQEGVSDTAVVELNDKCDAEFVGSRTLDQTCTFLRCLETNGFQSHVNIS